MLSECAPSGAPDRWGISVPGPMSSPARFQARLERLHQIHDPCRRSFDRCGDVMSGDLALDGLAQSFRVSISVASGLPIGGQTLDELSGQGHFALAPALA